MKSKCPVPQRTFSDLFSLESESDFPVKYVVRMAATTSNNRRPCPCKKHILYGGMKNDEDAVSFHKNKPCNPIAG
jgi:hypothetical protein